MIYFMGHFCFLVCCFCFVSVNWPNSFLGKSTRTSVPARAVCVSVWLTENNNKNNPSNFKSHFAPFLPSLQSHFPLRLFLPFLLPCPLCDLSHPLFLSSFLFSRVIYTFHSLPFFLNHTQSSSLIKTLNSSLTLLPSP